MFLITTADQRFWKTDGKVLFLGQWCKLYDQRAAWEKLDSQTLPYHWDDRERLYEDYLYLWDVFERYLAELSLGLVVPLACYGAWKTKLIDFVKSQL